MRIGERRERKERNYGVEKQRSISETGSTSLPSHKRGEGKTVATVVSVKCRAMGVYRQFRAASMRRIVYSYFLPSQKKKHSIL